ncbi:MAG: arginase [Deltaproteobacteria bacterium]|nr:arginase [Deltaproteobacteria bacterium]
MNDVPEDRVPTTPRGKHQIDILGFPMDLGADRRGVGMGPSALRIAGIRRRLVDLGYQVRDLGDIPVEIPESQTISNPRLKFLDEVVDKSGLLASAVLDSLDRGHFPLAMGGDHTVSIGSLAAQSAHCRARGLRPGVLWIDAHADMNDEQTTPSGNIHGMALAVSLGFGEERLTRLLGFSPKLEPEHAFLVGVRSIDQDERKLIRRAGLTVRTMADIDRRGAASVIEEILESLTRDVDAIHVTLDVDAVDPSLAQGVGTPVAGGLTYREAHLIMETIAGCGKLSGLDVAEINPTLDNRNRTAVLTAELVSSCLGKRIL